MSEFQTLSESELQSIEGGAEQADVVSALGGALLECVSALAVYTYDTINVLGTGSLPSQ